MLVTPPLTPEFERVIVLVNNRFSVDCPQDDCGPGPTPTQYNNDGVPSPL